MTNKIIVGGVITALVLSVLAFTRPAAIEKVLQPIVGASPGPDTFYPRTSNEGVAYWSWSSETRPATSTAITGATFCSYKVQATSTLEAATLRGTNEGYANTFEIGYANDTLATTTRLALEDVAASVPFEVVATTTYTAITDGVLIPGDYINFKVATGTLDSGFDISGKCVVETREI